MTNTNLLHKPILLTFLLAVFAIPVFCQAPEREGGVRSAEKGSRTTESRVIRMTSGQEKKQKEAAILLLGKAPVLTTSSDEKLEEEEFITLTRAITLTQTARINSSRQAIYALEDVLADAGNSTATIKSDPDKNEVTYRRYVDNSAPWQSATTNTKVSVRPALYVFRCTDRKSGATQQKTQSCTSNCTVEFKF